MAFRKVKKEIYEIDCDQCGHHYDTDTLPGRCGRCKCRTWNSKSDDKGRRLPDTPAEKKPAKSK